jgi:hypothetical protein
MSETKKIYLALAKILQEIDPIKKDRNADMGNAGKYKFRGIDDLYNALHNAFATNHVFILPEVVAETSQIVEKEKNGYKTYSKHVTLQIKYRFIADDGSEVSSIGIGEAIDTSDKATNKAQSSALKYVLMQMFLIPTEEKKDVEEDNELVAHRIEYISDVALKALLKDLKTLADLKDTTSEMIQKNICEGFKITNLTELTSVQAQATIKQVKAKIQLAEMTQDPMDTAPASYIEHLNK